jgi:hypothetical protein
METGMAALPMNALTFVDSGTLTAVVRYGLNVGTYDVVIINPGPGYEVGLLRGGLVVSYQPPPTIASVFPDSFPVSLSNQQINVCVHSLSPSLPPLSLVRFIPHLSIHLQADNKHT